MVKCFTKTSKCIKNISKRQKFVIFNGFSCQNAVLNFFLNVYEAEYERN